VGRMAEGKPPELAHAGHCSRHVVTEGAARRSIGEKGGWNVNVVRIALAVFFILAGLGGLVSGARHGQAFDFVVAAGLFAIAYALWPKRSRSRA
jgi:hypothetical protein